MMQTNTFFNDRSVHLFGVRVSSSTLAEVLGKLVSHASLPHFSGTITVFTPNSEQVVQAYYDDSFCHTLNQSTINVPDGIGLVWTHKILRRLKGDTLQIGERVTGIDLLEKLCAEAADAGLNVFLIGGKGTTAERAAKELKKRFEGLAVSSHAGPVMDNGDEMIVDEALVAMIQKAKPHFMFVGMGAGKQENFILRYKDRLNVPVMMVVGGALEMLAGKQVRAPLIWRKAGLEWLWRLLREPWRWKRQLKLVELAAMTMDEVLAVKP